jgi:curved DNA-binding protein CbpA
MDSSIRNYYTILGIEPSASHDAIKVAYRHLAREVHPDSNVSSSESEISAFSLQMAQLNEAYSVLSDAKLRREYDEQLRIQGILIPRNITPRVERRTQPRPVSGRRLGFRQHTDADSAVVIEYSNHLRSRFMLAKGSLSWKAKRLEGFDWGLEAFFWAAHYCIGLHGLTDLNPPAMKKFIHYAEVVIAEQNCHLRKSHFLFLLPFQRMNDWDAVSDLCHRFASADNHLKKAGPPTGILLLDIQHSRTLRFASSFEDEKFEQLHKLIGIPT